MILDLIWVVLFLERFAFVTSITQTTRTLECVFLDMNDSSRQLRLSKSIPSCHDCYSGISLFLVLHGICFPSS